MTVTESQKVWPKSQNGHVMVTSQHVTKKSADGYEDCGRQGA